VNKSVIICFHCREPGHYKTKCPQLIVPDIGAHLDDSIFYQEETEKKANELKVQEEKKKETIKHTEKRKAQDDLQLEEVQNQHDSEYEYEQHMFDIENEMLQEEKERDQKMKHIKSNCDDMIKTNLYDQTEPMNKIQDQTVCYVCKDNPAFYKSQFCDHKCFCMNCSLQCKVNDVCPVVDCQQKVGFPDLVFD